MQIVQRPRQASVRRCEAVGVLAAVGVFANAGQQKLTERLKGVMNSYEPGGVILANKWISVMSLGVML